MAKRKTAKAKCWEAATKLHDFLCRDGFPNWLNAVGAGDNVLRIYTRKRTKASIFKYRGYKVEWIHTGKLRLSDFPEYEGD